MRARWSSFGAEAIALARQAILLPFDAGAPVVPLRVEPGDDVAIFVHGLMASAGVLRPLRAAVSRHPRVHAAALTYAPGPGVEPLAARLGDLAASLDAGARLHLVGHSLGGIVARFWAQRTKDPRVVQTISLASPFAGVRGARAVPLGFARDLDPDGPVLREVRLADVAPRIPHLSIIAGADALVPAPVTQALPHGDVIVIDDVGHNGLLFDAAVARHVERRILAASRRDARFP
jgi:pimeloyl-ACP methyl ester carboxylesterase